MAQAKQDKDQAKDAAQTADDAAKEGHIHGQRANATTVEGEKPGQPAINTAPGDAPFDTTDPNERISTLIPSGAEAMEAAIKGLPVVAYVKTGNVNDAQVNRDDSEDRIEEYEVWGVKIRHNLETGESVRV